MLNDSPLRTARDLLDKTISMNTLGAHSEFMVKEFLSRGQLTPEEARRVTLLVIPPVNGEQLLREKQVDVATLGDIYRDRALERGGIRSLFSDYELYGKFTAGSYVMKTSFIKENPKTARRFVEATAKAIEWARDTPRETVVARCLALMKKRGRNEEDSAIKFWRSYGVAGKGGLIAERDFQVWIDWMVKSGELKPGEIALSRVYTNELNPLRERAGREIGNVGRRGDGLACVPFCSGAAVAQDSGAERWTKASINRRAMLTWVGGRAAARARTSRLRRSRGRPA